MSVIVSCFDLTPVGPTSRQSISDGMIHKKPDFCLLVTVNSLLVTNLIPFIRLAQMIT